MALTIFVSILAAEAECGFSKLAVVEDCLWSTMGQYHLSTLVMLSSEHDLARKLSYDMQYCTFVCSNKGKKNTLNLTVPSVLVSKYITYQLISI